MFSILRNLQSLQMNSFLIYSNYFSDISKDCFDVIFLNGVLFSCSINILN